MVLSLNPQLAPGLPTQWLRLPWTIFAGLSLVVCVGFAGHRIISTGVGGVVAIVHGIRNPGPSSREILATVAELDPETHFEDLLRRASRDESPEVREAATARLRSHPQFLERLSTELETGYVEPALAFLRDATLSPAETSRFARPACTALRRWVGRIPAPNYTTKSHLKALRRWGTEMFRVLPDKFAGAGVDFAPVLDDFKDKVEPTR